MKIILISLILVALLSFSAYAGCCVLETSPNLVYWDFEDWEHQTSFCNKIGPFLSLTSTWYSEDCDKLDTTIIPSGSINGWDSDTPISPPTTGGGGGGGGSRRTTTTLAAPACEEIAYVCDPFSECVNDMESRDCTKKMICDGLPKSRIIKEVRSCVSPAVEETTVEETAAPTETTTEETTAEEEGGFAAITGAVIGAVGKAPVAYGITFVVIIGILIGVASLYSKKKKAKKKKE